MNIFKLLIICSLFVISLQSFAQVTEKNYKIYSVQAEKEVTLSEIAVDMKDYDVLFYGEEHNDSVTHFLEHKNAGRTLLQVQHHCDAFYGDV